MKWMKQFPEKDGLYWMADPHYDNGVEMVRVVNRRVFDFLEGEIFDGTKGYQFHGPIPQPKAPPK